MKYAGFPVGHGAALRRGANGIWPQLQRAVRAAMPNPAERAAQPCGPKGAGDLVWRDDPGKRLCIGISVAVCQVSRNAFTEVSNAGTASQLRAV